MDSIPVLFKKYPVNLTLSLPSAAPQAVCKKFVGNFKSPLDNR